MVQGARGRKLLPARVVGAFIKIN